MLKCRTILQNQGQLATLELILSLYESNAPGSRVHASKAPCASISMHDWYFLAASKNIFPMGPQLANKLTHTHCEVHCNMIIFMLCHCASLQGPNIRSPMWSLFGGFTVLSVNCLFHTINQILSLNSICPCIHSAITSIEAWNYENIKDSVPL